MLVFAFRFIAPTVRAVASGGGEIIYALPFRMVILAQIPWVLAALLVMMVFWSVQAWRSAWWSLAGRLCYTAVLVSASLSVALLVHWRYLPAHY